jgi:hypothetical protein
MIEPTNLIPKLALLATSGVVPAIAKTLFSSGLLVGKLHKRFSQYQDALQGKSEIPVASRRLRPTFHMDDINRLLKDPKELQKFTKNAFGIGGVLKRYAEGGEIPEWAAKYPNLYSMFGAAK